LTKYETYRIVMSLSRFLCEKSINAIQAKCKRPGSKTAGPDPPERFQNNLES